MLITQQQPGHGATEAAGVGTASLPPFSKGGIILSVASNPSVEAATPSRTTDEAPTAMSAPPAATASASSSEQELTPRELRRQRRASMSELRRDLASMYESDGDRQAFADMARLASVQFEQNTREVSRRRRSRRLSEGATVSGSMKSNPSPTTVARRASMPSSVVFGTADAPMAGPVTTPGRAETPSSSAPSGPRPSRSSSRVLEFSLLNPAIAEVDGDVAESPAIETKPLTQPMQPFVAAPRAASPELNKATSTTSTVIPAEGEAAVPTIGLKRRLSLTVLLRRVSRFCSRRRR